MVLSTWLAYGLLVAAQAASPTLTIGTCTTPPAVDVAVPVTFQGGDTPPASMALWVHFDASRFQFVSVTSGDVVTAAQKTLSSSVPETGILHLVLWGINLGTIHDGLLGTIHFTALPSAPDGDYPLAVSNDSMADPEATPLAHTCVNGVIRVRAAGEGEGEGEGEPPTGCVGAPVSGGNGAGRGPWLLLAYALPFTVSALFMKRMARPRQS